jgi:zinc protease
MPDNRLPLVQWKLTMRRGSQSDPKGKEGVAWLTSEMLRRGVEGMTFEQLTQDLDSRAISITVGDGGDNTELTGHATTDQLEHGVERSRQILRTPTFPADEFAKLKEQSVNSLQLAQESPATVAGNDLTTALFGDTPIGRYSTPKSVESITLDDVKAFYEKFYKPNDAIVMISGDVTVEKGRSWRRSCWPIGSRREGGCRRSRSSWRSSEAAADHSGRSAGREAGDRAHGRAGVLDPVGREVSRLGRDAHPVVGIDSRLGKYVRAQKGWRTACAASSTRRGRRARSSARSTPPSNPPVTRCRRCSRSSTTCARKTSPTPSSPRPRARLRRNGDGGADDRAAGGGTASTAS